VGKDGVDKFVPLFSVVCSLCRTMSRDADTLRHQALAVTSPRPLRHSFSVRSLGWTSVDLNNSVRSNGDDDFDRCSVRSRVNKSISQLSLGRHDMSDAVGRWGDVRTTYCTTVCTTVCTMYCSVGLIYEFLKSFFSGKMLGRKHNVNILGIKCD